MLFRSGVEHPLWVTPKLQIVASKELDVAVGTMHFFGIEDLNGGIAYAVATHGQPDAAVTVGAGWGYSGSNVGSAIIMLGGERRMSPRTKFITENYVSTKTGRGVLRSRKLNRLERQTRLRRLRRFRSTLGTASSAAAFTGSLGHGFHGRPHLKQDALA